MDLFTLLGRIVINADEATKDIDKVTDKAKQSDKGISDSFKKSEKTVNAFAKGGLVLAAGVTAAYGTLTAFGAKMLDNAGTIKDSADRVGMAAEEYQKWTFAAEQSGLTAESLESAMIKQQKSFAEAKTGNEAMAESYKMLGLDISKIGSSSEAFDLVMAKLGDMEDETTRNALAADIFGKSYAGLTPLLNEGSTGIDNLKQKAVDLGAVMSNETVAAGEELGDKLDQVKAAGNGLLNTLGEVALPILNRFADWFLTKAPEIETKVKPVFEGIAAAINWVVQNSNWLIPVITGVVAAFVGMQIVGVVSNMIALYTAFVGKATLFQAIWNAVMAANPIMLIVLAIAALIAIGVALIMNWDKVKAWFIGFFDKMKEIFGKIGEVIAEPFRRAGEVIKTIMAGLVNVVKAPINAIIKGINAFIGGLNKIKIPDWVPAIGGNGINIPKIPMLAKGTDYFQGGTAIVGEYEPELVELPRGARVTPFSRMGSSPAVMKHEISGTVLVRAPGQEYAEQVYEFVMDRIDRDMKLAGAW